MLKYTNIFEDYKLIEGIQPVKGDGQLWLICLQVLLPRPVHSVRCFIYDDSVTILEIQSKLTS